MDTNLIIQSIFGFLIFGFAVYRIDKSIRIKRRGVRVIANIIEYVEEFDDSEDGHNTYYYPVIKFTGKNDEEVVKKNGHWFFLQR